MERGSLVPIDERASPHLGGRTPAAQTEVASFRAAGALSLILASLAFVQYAARAFRYGAILTSWKYQVVLGAWGLGLILGLGWMLAARGKWAPSITALASRTASTLSRHRLASLGLFLLTVLALPFAVLGPAGRFLEPYLGRVLLAWALSLAGAVLLHAAWPKQRWVAGWGASALIQGCVYLLATFMPSVSSYPLSMGWSEASRYYYASLFFSESVYGFRVPWPVLHPSRYLLQAIPFLVPNLPLWFHRLWQVLLWIGMTIATSMALVRRLTFKDRLAKAAFCAWGFLYLLQAPVYYHLLLAALLVIWGFDGDRPLRSLFVVGLASVWAGISRINWIPVPCFLATLLYILERPFRSAGAKSLAYWLNPVLWVGVGAASGLAANTAYAVVSGNPLGEFTSSFTSNLLWYRLLPNATFPVGVLPGILFVSAPLALVFVFGVLAPNTRFHPLELLALAGMSLALLAGGLIVSTKIGGGGNLHNLDAFMVLLLVAGSCVFFGPVRGAEGAGKIIGSVRGWLIPLVVAVPVMWLLMTETGFVARDRDAAQAAIEVIQDTAARASERGGEVLFMSERHLLTFRMIEGVPLVPEYEKIYLMEMAMAGNEAYLGAFCKDVEEGRFALVVAEPMPIQFRGRDHSFGEEDDIWVRRVTVPFLEHYQPIQKLEDVGVWLYAPVQK